MRRFCIFKFQFYHDLLTLTLLVKFSADDILKYFSYISQKTEFDISSADSLHEMSNPVFCEK